ncbi:hypothetical protein FBQ87_13985 [Sphingobacteriales bacterium CHB3]|nr:hypothetical protein [Sphingobacteriales bacterium CHB3]
MTLETVLTLVTNRLDQLEIPYMVVGSIASSFHGMLRTTYDADIVIDPDKNSLQLLIRTLENDFYADEAMALEALDKGHMFNVIHSDTGHKIDLIIRKPRVYDRMSLSRRSRATYHEKPVWFSSPEDTILAKLEWTKENPSERQMEDALNIIKHQRDSLNFAYLHQWAKELDVDELLRKLLFAAGIGK